ncbi:papain family cysteine protease [Ostertagia ostertagi]
MHLTPEPQNRVRRSYMRRSRPRFTNPRLFPIRPTGKDNFSDIPERFDARERWPNCPSLFQIVDQAGCGSCWALSTASAISDRLCINTKGALTVNISAEDLLTCCKTCGASDGCLGGWPIRGFRFFASDGLVTGGPFGDKVKLQEIWQEWLLFTELAQGHPERNNEARPGSRYHHNLWRLLALQKWYL